jgi:transposase
MLDLEEFLMLRDLFNRELSISEIARRTGHRRGTVRKYLRAQVPPSSQERSKKPSKLDGYREYIVQRLQEIQPGRNNISRNKEHFQGLLSEILKQNSNRENWLEDT